MNSVNVKADPFLEQNKCVTFLMVFILFLYHCVTFRGEGEALGRSEGSVGTGGEGGMGEN